MATPVITPAPETAPQTPAAEQTPVTVSPQEAARREMYERYYGTSEATPATPVVDPSAAPAAEAVPTPEPVAAAPVPPEYLQALQAIQAELATLKAQTAPAAAAPAPTAPEPDWISLLREGKVDEAKAALVNDVRKDLQAPMVEQAVGQARAIARAEAEIDTFVRDLRNANQDIIDMEGFVTLDAQQRLAQVQASGKIKTTEDAVREYKKAVLEATDFARKTAQKLRSSGKNEAMVRSREVLAASTLPPQQIVQPTQTTNEPQVELDPVQAARDYIEKRKAGETSRRGLAV